MLLHDQVYRLVVESIRVSRVIQSVDELRAVFGEAAQVRDVEKLYLIAFVSSRVLMVEEEALHL